VTASFDSMDSAILRLMVRPGPNPTAVQAGCADHLRTPARRHAVKADKFTANLAQHTPAVTGSGVTHKKANVQAQ